MQNMCSREIRSIDNIVVMRSERTCDGSTPVMIGSGKQTPEKPKARRRSEEGRGDK